MQGKDVMLTGKARNRKTEEEQTRVAEKSSSFRGRLGGTKAKA
jgi:hypothetical protein